jgi:hypothetical protein
MAKSALVETGVAAELVPRTASGDEDVSTRGGFCLVYQHPDDLHATPIFDGVSLGFIKWYILTRRTFFIDSVSLGWSWHICPALPKKGRTVHETILWS